ncbi:MAG: tyrosine-type recombinase/integrase [Beijerinckiaceae bacterium]|nr:tyrosine-type recombinase/integrase [Beijerinckiaceae bacterium]
MPWIKPRYLWEDADRHGNIRLYVARPGHAKIRIHAEPDSPAFWDAYALALNGVSVPKNPRVAQITPALTGTFRWLVEQYKGSVEFRALGASTRSTRGNIFDSILREPLQPGSADTMAVVPLSAMTAAHVRGLRDRKRDLPEGANGRLKAIRGLYKWALAQDDLVKRFGLTVNPARDVPTFKMKTDGYHTWSPEEVAIFEAHHPIGTTPRLFLALLMFTGQRRSDVIRFGRQHIRTETDSRTGRQVSWLRFTQRKNRENKAVALDLPMLDVLREIIAASKCGDLTFMISGQGKPYSDAGIGIRMRQWCDAAGLPHCTAHGLRKAGACIAAENGATEKQMMAIFGWTDNRMAARYSRKANQKRIAGDSMHLISRRRDTAEAPAPLLDWRGNDTPTFLGSTKSG